VTAVALQLFAYHVARLRGCEIDQPETWRKASPWSERGMETRLSLPKVWAWQAPRPATGGAAPRSAEVGRWGEACAAEYLSRAGYAVISRNVRPNRRDEIDIVARFGDTLVFVEVKTRSREDYGRPFKAVDRKKRHALNRAAAAFLRKAKHPGLYYRFDVVEVLGTPKRGHP
jgi:putative endonuclease